MRRAKRQPERHAFTLIEMLVAIGIILTLASLAVAFLPSLNDRQRGTQGALIVQTALNTARHRALRDQSARGVRLNLDATNTTAATSLQFIEQPADFTGGYASTTGTASGGKTATIQFQQAPDLYAGFGSNQANMPYWAVQPGDYFVLNGTQVFLIQTVQNSASSQTGDQIVVQTGTSNPLAATVPTTNYQIERAPRIMTGDDPIQLPDKIGIDLSSVINNSGATRSLIAADSHGGQTYYDILFDPSGRVLRQGTALGKIILWVRDITDASMSGDQVLITVYTRSGLVEHAIADPGPNNDYNPQYTSTSSSIQTWYDKTNGQWSPYTFALQGQGSGQ